MQEVIIQSDYSDHRKSKSREMLISDKQGVLFVSLVHKRKPIKMAVLLAPLTTL